MELTIPADYKFLNVVSACIAALLERAANIEERSSVTYNVELAVHEICTNIVEHAYKGRSASIHITMHLIQQEQPHRLTIELMDTGHSFDWSTVTEPDLTVPQEGNYGLFLVRNLVDELDYRREERTNHWRLVKYL